MSVKIVSYGVLDLVIVEEFKMTTINHKGHTLTGKVSLSFIKDLPPEEKESLFNQFKSTFERKVSKTERCETCKIRIRIPDNIVFLFNAWEFK